MPARDSDQQALLRPEHQVNRTRVAMYSWLQTMDLIAGGKKGISSDQPHRILGITLATARFTSHRIREALRLGGLARFVYSAGAIEVDETIIGRKKGREVGNWVYSGAYGQFPVY